MTGPLQALAERYDRQAIEGAVPIFGYAIEPISFALVISPEGEPVATKDLRARGGNGLVPNARLVPQGIKRTSGIAAHALWDKTAYVFGRSAKPSRRNADRHGAFKKRNCELLTAIDDEGARALIRLLETWVPGRFDKSPFTPEMLDANFVFQLSTDSGCDLHLRPKIRVAWQAQLGNADALTGHCLVRGGDGPIARIHPTIRGVAGAQPSGASLVSFNLNAFESHGKGRGANAPVSQAAAFAYGTALNRLLEKGSCNTLRIGDMTVAFWAEVSGAEAIARDFFNPPQRYEIGETANLSKGLKLIAHDRPFKVGSVEIAARTRFYLLGLAPNAGRLSIRFWHDSTLGELAGHLWEHWQDLRIEPNPWNGGLPAMWRLLSGLAPRGEPRNVPAHLAGELTRSILTGARYPRSLMALLLMRLRADRVVDGRRAALLKACIVRDLRRSNKSSTETDLVSLDPGESNEGYRLGRLFAVLESLQRAALGNVNATIRDRFYGAASATPTSVFPLLILKSRHHFASLRKSAKGGLAFTLEQDIRRIVEGFGTNFPRHLCVEDQSRFAIGYYHQRFSRRSSPPELAQVDRTDIAGVES